MTRRMRTSRAGIELIKSFEGFRPRAVKLESGGYLVGYGHRRSAREGAKITEADAELLLREYDLPAVEEAIGANVLTPLDQNEFDALASFIFNIGIENFEASEALALLNTGQKIAAIEAMSAWRMARLHGRMIVVDALVRRRAAERALFLDHPSGRVPVPTALIAPRLDVTARLHEATDDTAEVEPRFEEDEAAFSIGPVSYEDFAGPVIIEDDLDETATPETDRAVGAGDEVGVDDATSDEELNAPEAAAQRVRARLTRILDDSPDGAVAARIDEDVEGPSIEEITAAVSALAEPSEDQTEASPGEAPPRPAGQRRVATGNGAAPLGAAAGVEIDDMEDAESVMRRIEAELSGGRTPAGEKVPDYDARSGRGRWVWSVVATIGAVLMLWGMADRFALLPEPQTMTGTDYDPLPPLFVLGGLILVGLGVWNMIAGSLREDG